MSGAFEVGRRARVTARYERVYPDPIVMQVGDEVRVEREDEEAPGWWWCVHPDGRSGWVPEAYFVRGGSVGVAQRDYSAVELTVEEGEEVALGELVNGWYWVTNAAGERGWVPAANLELRLR
jgi:hypothetical protein